MATEKLFSNVQSYLEKSERVLILLHLYPDGDTIASSLALASYLKKNGKKAECAVKGSIPQAFKFMSGTSEIKDDFLLGDYDLIIAVDCGDTHRTGYPARLEQICKTKPLINIDHHFRNNLHKIAKVNLVDEKASAAAEIIWEFLKFLHAEIDSKIATYILAGIYFDTGGFQHSNVTVKTLQIVAECLSLGGRIAQVASHINGSKSSSALRLWGIVLNRMRISSDNIVTSVILQKDLISCAAKDEDASGVVNLINSVPKAKLAVLFVETPDGKIKASLRSESDRVDVASLARIFGGGGHKKAAGFTIEGKLVEKNGKWRIVGEG